MATRYEQQILEMIQDATRSIKATPVNLGGVAGIGGGVGGPPGGFVGRLPQTRVAYDESEIGTDYTPVSGMSLLDNLNHIRNRLNIIESGSGGSGIAGITVEEFGGIPSVPDVVTIVFSGAVNVVDNGGGQATVEITASGSGGIEEAPTDGSIYGRQNGGWTVVLSSGLNVNHIYNEDHTPSGVTTVFYTDFTYISGTLRLYVNGIRQRYLYDYIQSSGLDYFTTTFTTYSGDVVIVDYDYYEIILAMLDSEGLALTDSYGAFLTDSI